MITQKNRNKSKKYYEKIIRQDITQLHLKKKKSKNGLLSEKVNCVRQKNSLPLFYCLGKVKAWL